jgi:hypothetical protein
MATTRLLTTLCQAFPLPSISSCRRYEDSTKPNFFTGLLWISVSLTNLVQVKSSDFEINRTSSEPCSMVKLPPASPFDNFLKAAYRTQQEM